MEYDVAVIGGGPAGMAAALGAVSFGAARVLLIERDNQLGGILNQCTHRGFGLKYFGTELTGIEYAERLRQLVNMSNIDVLTDTIVLKVSKDRKLTLSGKELIGITAKAVVLASGCRERPAGALPVTGTRPSGIFTAGMAQRMLNLGGYSIGSRAVILGSGDVGMIVAREMKKRGAEVEAVIEQAEIVGGLERNRVSCLEAYQIPVLFHSTIRTIHGSGRITGVTYQDLSKDFQDHIPCDTLIVSVGLVPERELLEGVMADAGEIPDFLFVCGNASHVYAIVDSLYEDSGQTGILAAAFAAGHPLSG